MTKVGILVHCRHLETIAWEELVFGIPSDDALGDLAMLAWVVLQLEPSEEVASLVIGCGPSRKGSLSEGEYTKQFLLDNFDRLHDFSRLAPLLDALDDSGRRAFRAVMEQIIVTPEIKNTVAEIELAAKIFADSSASKVLQICAASHASRCIKEQAVARSHGTISKQQLWHTVATDMSYHDTKPEDICVIEPLHRRDQPMTFVRPGLSEVMAPYFFLPDQDKKALVQLVDAFMTSHKK
jgi:hypothetical protein